MVCENVIPISSPVINVGHLRLSALCIGFLGRDAVATRAADSCGAERASRCAEIGADVAEGYSQRARLHGHSAA
jgi:hypothetical protein